MTTRFVTRHYLWIRIPIIAVLLSASVACAASTIVETVDIDRVPSAFPVGFCLLTHGNQQYVTYFNANHQMIVAQRQLDQPQWQKVTLPSKVGWDSHNYITMAIDTDGNLHLTGNMHCVPLVYFRTREPGDITTFEHHAMTGKDEQRCTYPRFVRTNTGKLLFMYRSGRSGNGRRLINGYDPATRTWSRFLETPLFDGQGKRNAYPIGPTRGPDGWFHVLWVWRDTPDCATNHDLSYARSRDLQHWESVSGVPARLPITLSQTALCVDPIPAGGGIINGGEKLAFDADDRPVIAYHKSDPAGNMQIYVAREADGRWQSTAVTQWDKPIEFSGGGAMPFIGINVGSFRSVAPGVFRISYRHRDYGSGWIFLSQETLKPVVYNQPVPSPYPSSVMRPTLAVPGMNVRLALDVGAATELNTVYVLRWETLGANHDRPRQPPLPPPSQLQVVKLRTAPSMETIQSE